MGFLVDSHCHLSFLENEGFDLDSVLKEADDYGVRIVQDICTSMEEFPRVLKIAEKYSNVYCSLGVHPGDIKNEIVTVEELVEKSKNKNVIGLGEVGLEYHFEPFDKVKQRKNFEVHIEAARQTGLPVIIHSRDSDDDMIDILESEMNNGEFSFVLHCFSSSKRLAYKGLDLGGYISLSGIVTFKNAKELREIVKDIPIERIILETDAPYLSPEPKRGQINKPGYVKYIAEYLVDFLKISFNDIQRVTTENFLNLFNKVEVNNEKN